MLYYQLIRVSCYISDNSAFSEVQKQVEGGFRLFNQYAVFTYSQLQNILPDSALGDISDWDNFLHLDMDQPDLLFKTCDEFVLNEDFHRLVMASRLPRPSKFVEQSISFCKAFCKLLLRHEIAKSDLIRGLSAFDPAVVFETPEKHYTTAIEKLSTHFVTSGWISASDKVKIISQYRAFVTKMRASAVPEYDDWILYLSSNYEMQCRTELFLLFKYSCLCLPPLVGMLPEVIIPISNLESDVDMFRSCLRSLQASYLTVPHVSSLYRDPRAIPRVFRLLGRGMDLLSDKKFSVWNFLKGSGPRRASLLGKLETGYRKAVLRSERPPISSSSTTPSVSRHSSVNSTPSPDPSLGRVNLEVRRCGTSSSEDVSKKSKAPTGKEKKN